MNLRLVSLLLVFMGGTLTFIGGIGIMSDLRQQPYMLCERSFDTGRVSPDAGVSEIPESTRAPLPIGGAICVYPLTSGETYVYTSSWMHTFMFGAGVGYLLSGITCGVIGISSHCRQISGVDLARDNEWEPGI